MGNQQFTELVAQANEEHDGHFFIAEGGKAAKLKQKEAQILVKKLIRELPGLVEIIAKGWKLKTIPSNIFDAYANLEMLSMPENKLEKLPVEMSSCNIVELCLSENAFKEFPFDVLKAMPSLTILDFSSNQISTFPEVKPKDFPRLVKISLEANNFSQFPCEVCGISTLRSLNMNNNKLPELPLDIGRLMNLEELRVKQNQFQELPISLRQLKKLRVLDCSENELTELPDDISFHTKLEILEAQHNQIQVIPDVVFGLTNLTTLRMHGNQIKVLPKGIGNLEKLSELNLKENELTECPAEIGKCTSLRKLFLEYNQLTNVPVEVCELKRLLILILHHNQITTIPEELKEMRQLMRFSLNANPLDEETLAIMKEGGALALLKPLEIGDGNYSTGTVAAMGTYTRRSMRRASSADQTPNNMQQATNASLKVAPKSTSKHPQKDVNSAQLQAAFTTLLEREDFSSKKKHMLNKLSDDQKWELMQQYQGSTLELMKNNAGGAAVKKKKRPQKDYPKLIREGRANKNTLASLVKLLKENEENYVTTFVNGGGIQSLTLWLSSFTRKETLSIRDAGCILECLSILHTLTKVSVRSVITTSECISIVCSCVTKNEKIRQRAIDVLENIVNTVPQVGPAMVMEAITSLGEDDIRFHWLLAALAGAEDVDDKFVCLSLINGLVESVEDLEERFTLRSEFNRAGMLDKLNEIQALDNAPLLQYERERYQEELRQDYEDMMSIHDKKKVLKLSQSQELDEKIPEGSVRVCVALASGNLHGNYTAIVELSSTIESLLEAIGLKYAIKTKEFGIWYANCDGCTPDRLLPNESTLIDAKLDPDQFMDLECKMLPWPVCIHLPDGQVCMHLVNPDMTVQATVQEFLKQNPFGDGEEYSLFIPGRHEGTFRYLDEMKPISETSLKKKKYRDQLFLRRRPITIRVKLSQDMFQTMVFDAAWDVETILKEIASHISKGTVNLNVNEYRLVLVDDQSGESVNLENDRLLSSYAVTENSCLKLQSTIAPEKDEDSADSATEAEDDKAITDVNIWEEPADDETNITFEGGKSIQNIETATLNKLVERVTSDDEYDVDFMNVFLFMFHSFCTPQELWTKLMQRYNIPNHIPEERAHRIRYRVCTFIKNWVDKEAIEDSVKEQMESFVEEQLRTQEQLQIFASAITKSLASPKGSDQMHISEKPPAPLLPKNLGPDQGLTFFVIEESEIARQLTLITFEIYQKIKPEEFFNQNWSKEKTKHLSPNLNALVKLFNDVSTWVASVLVLERQVRNRAKLMTRLITIAAHLRELNNYHLVMAFISAINTSSVGRLKYTRDRLPKRSKQTLLELEESMSMQSAFSKYRQMLKDSKPPCVPYIGVYLTDLTFMGDGNPDIIDGRVNYAKHKLVYSVVAIITAYQKVPYNFVEVWSIKEFLLNQPQLSESDLFKQSLIIEPRNAERKDIK